MNQNLYRSKIKVLVKEFISFSPIGCWENDTNDIDKYLATFEMATKLLITQPVYLLILLIEKQTSNLCLSLQI